MSIIGTSSTKCPHCRAECRNIRSVQINALYREITFMCKNNNCGYMFIAGMEPIRTLVESLKPNPDIQIKVSFRRRGEANPDSLQGAAS